MIGWDNSKVKLLPRRLHSHCRVIKSESLMRMFIGWDVRIRILYFLELYLIFLFFFCILCYDSTNVCFSYLFWNLSCNLFFLIWYSRCDLLLNIVIGLRFVWFIDNLNNFLITLILLVVLDTNISKQKEE